MRVIETGLTPVKLWDDGVVIQDEAIQQFANVAQLPFVKPYVVGLPDSHWGNGGPIGAVIPTIDAICPSLVGSDIGCGMMACKLGSVVGGTPLVHAYYSPGFLEEIFKVISKAVPHGRTDNGGKGDRGAWHNVPLEIHEVWMNEFYDKAFKLSTIHPKAVSKNGETQLGTLGTGNHFIELSADESNGIWIVLHSGSRGFGNRIGGYFTERAKENCAKYFVGLPDRELAYLPRGTQDFDDYISALHLSQRYAWRNREIMMTNVLKVLGTEATETVHCHHNYMAEERHFGKKLFITRKGAVRAERNDMVIIPGAMGRKTFIARGLGNRDSFCSCSHGAGRAMGRKEAERRFTVADHVRETTGLVCDKTSDVLDETPEAYKDVDKVMAAQADLVEPIHTLRALVCIKGLK